MAMFILNPCTNQAADDTRERQFGSRSIRTDRYESLQATTYLNNQNVTLSMISTGNRDRFKCVASTFKPFMSVPTQPCLQSPCFVETVELET